MARKLTDKQEAYKNNRIKGIPVGKAYSAAYDTSGMSDNAASKEASKLEHDPRIAPAIAKAKKSVADKVLVTVEDVVRGLLKETKEEVEGSTPGSRISAWKILSDHTGSFDANKQKLEHSGEIHVTHEQWLDTLD